MCGVGREGSPCRKTNLEIEARPTQESSKGDRLRVQWGGIYRYLIFTVAHNLKEVMALCFAVSGTLYKSSGALRRR